jgi:hypothetical protein
MRKLSVSARCEAWSEDVLKLLNRSKEVGSFPL